MGFKQNKGIHRITLKHYVIFYFLSTEVDDSSGERQKQRAPKGTNGKHWIKLDRAVHVRTCSRGSAGSPL